MLGTPLEGSYVHWL